MTKEEVLKKVNEIFIDILDNEDIVLNDSSKAEDIEEWDSLSHIQLVVAIEKKFKIKFSTQEIQGWKNIGSVCESILNKI